MHAAPRWSRGRAEIETRVGCAVGDETGQGAGKKLKEISRTAINIAADIVGIIGFQLRGWGHVPGQNARTETWRETLDLLLDTLCHVKAAAVRHVAIGPHGLLACRGARRVKKALLCQQDIRARRRLTSPALTLR